jgi:hypothetical protein
MAQMQQLLHCSYTMEHWKKDTTAPRAGIPAKMGLLA